jgi:hypothetical protein
MGDADNGRSGFQFLQSSQDQRIIYALVWRGNRAFAYGPLEAKHVYRDLYISAHGTLREGDLELAYDLLARSSEFHNLDEYFRYFGYDSWVASWADGLPDEHDLSIAPGHTFEEVVARLGLNDTTKQALWDAALYESVSQHLDSAGDLVYFGDFSLGNWALDLGPGGLRIDTSNYRFKVWLSFHT